MKKVNIIYTILAFMLVILMGSCRKDPVVGGTATQKLAGEWWVKFDGGIGYVGITTYNTAANRPDSIWIDDNVSSYWGFQGKIGCNASSGTFSAQNAVNINAAPATFTVTGGKIMPNAAHAPWSHDKTDSISFSISFSDEPLSPVHTVAGYKRTGFAGDDH